MPEYDFQWSEHTPQVGGYASLGRPGKKRRKVNIGFQVPGNEFPPKPKPRRRKPQPKVDPRTKGPRR